MKQAIICATLLLLFIVLGGSALVITQDVSIIPHVFIFEGHRYRVDTEFAAGRAVTIQQDFDGDGKAETLLGFQARTDDEVGVPGSFIMLGHKTQNKFIPEIIRKGHDYFHKVELKDTDSDGRSEILFWSGRGAHYTDLDIYKYVKGEIKQFFSKGSACGVQIIEGKSFRIKVFHEKFDVPNWNYTQRTDRWEIWEWDGRQFVFNEGLSTTS
jgi:hypothetical protein